MEERCVIGLECGKCGGSGYICNVCGEAVDSDDTNICSECLEDIARQQEKETVKND